MEQIASSSCSVSSSASSHGTAGLVELGTVRCPAPIFVSAYFRSLFCEVHLWKKKTAKAMFLKMSLTESVQLNVLTILTNQTGGWVG